MEGAQCNTWRHAFELGVCFLAKITTGAYLDSWMAACCNSQSVWTGPNNPKPPSKNLRSPEYVSRKVVVIVTLQLHHYKSKDMPSNDSQLEPTLDPVNARPESWPLHRMCLGTRSGRRVALNCAMTKSKKHLTAQCHALTAFTRPCFKEYKTQALEGIQGPDLIISHGMNDFLKRSWKNIEPISIFISGHPYVVSSR